MFRKNTRGILDTTDNNGPDSLYQLIYSQIYIFFIYFEKVYDSLDKQSLIKILKEFSFPIPNKVREKNTAIKMQIANTSLEKVRANL